MLFYILFTRHTPASLNLRTSEAMPLTSFVDLDIHYLYHFIFLFNILYYFPARPLKKEEKSGITPLSFFSIFYHFIFFYYFVIQEKESSKLKFATREHTQPHGRTYPKNYHLCGSGSRTNRHPNQSSRRPD